MFAHPSRLTLRFLELLSAIVVAVVLSAAGPVWASPWTEGPKTLLYIRPDFDDLPGEPMPKEQIESVFVDIDKFLDENSQGKTSIKVTVTPVLRMPHPATWYEERGWVEVLKTDAMAAAAKAGFDVAKYDLQIVASKNNKGSGGVGGIHAKGLALSNGYGLGITMHELSHNLGLPHPSYWHTLDGTVIGDGGREPYGIPFDPSSGGGADDVNLLLQHHYNSRYKNVLNWLPDSAVQTLTSSGSYQLNPHDIAGASGIRVLKIPIDSTKNYWMELRQNETEDPSFKDGILVYWTYNGNVNCDLLDMTPNSWRGAWDAALTIGRTFSDAEHGIYVTPVAELPLNQNADGKLGFADNTDPQNANTPISMKVVVNIGHFEGNRSPSLQVQSLALRLKEGQSATFSATGIDPDGDALSYFWDFGDGSVAGGSPSITKSWQNPGDYIVRCTATDMKGGTASASVIVSVPSQQLISHIYRISGRVTSNGQPLADVMIRASKDAYVLTDSDGTYTLVNLPAGSYTLDASKPGFEISQTKIESPLSIGPSIDNLNFVARPSTAEALPATPTTQQILSDFSQPGALSLAPAICSSKPGHLDIFVRGRDHCLWTRSYNNGAWSAWKSLGGVLTSSPARRFLG